MPFIRTSVLTMGKPLVDALLGALSARPAGALLTTPTVHLFTAGPTQILPTSLPADFTEATFAGYVDKTLTLPLLGPINLDLGDGEGVHNEVDFLAGAVVAPGQDILGYWIDDGATAVLYGAEIFPTPISIVNPGDYVSLDVIFPTKNPVEAT
jgi:hypothetical protein